MTTDLVAEISVGLPLAKETKYWHAFEKCIYSRDKSILLPTYKTLALPHLEYAYSLPFNKQDALELGRVQ